MDFYQLPFPNDIRIKAGRVNLTGHPRPGLTILSVDIVDLYVSAIEAETAGFGANQAMYLRFSTSFDASRFPPDCAATLVDITPTSPTYGFNVGITCSAVNASANYICGPYMWLRPYLGSPLRPGTTYALLVRKTILDTLGNPFGADVDFLDMLKATPPATAEVAAAYPAYQPLRDYIAAGKAAAAMAASVEAHWPGPVHGLVITRRGHDTLSHTRSRQIEVIEAGHPLPDAADADFGTIYEDRDGALWVAGTHLYRFIGPRAVLHRFPPPAGPRGRANGAPTRAGEIYGPPAMRAGGCQWRPAMPFPARPP